MRGDLRADASATVLDAIERARAAQQAYESRTDVQLELGSDVCDVCGRIIEPEARYFTAQGEPKHMLCDELQIGS